MNAQSYLSLANEKADQLTTRTRQAKAVLFLLSMAIEDESPPLPAMIIDALSAIDSLLSDR